MSVRGGENKGGPASRALGALSAVALTALFGLALGAARRPLPTALGDYPGLAASLRWAGVFGWNGSATADRGIAFPALLCALRDPGLLPWANAVLVTFMAALAGWLACAACSPVAGLCAVAGFLACPGLLEWIPSYRIEPFSGFLITCVGAAAALWCWRPGKAAALLLGLALAESLLCRSSLCLFVPLFAILARSRPASSRGPGQRAAVLLLVAAFLAPWIARNARRFGAFIPLERGPGVYALLGASAGHSFGEDVSTDDLARLLAPNAKQAPDEFDAVLAVSWANIRARPGAYVGFCGLQFAKALARHPWLYALAALGAFFLRSDVRIEALALLVLSFLIIHSAVVSQARYFAPLLPVVIVLAACGISQALKRAGLRLEGLDPAPRPWGIDEKTLARLLGLALALLYGASVAALTWEGLVQAVPCRLHGVVAGDLTCGRRALEAGDQGLAAERLRSACARLENATDAPAFVSADARALLGLLRSGPERGRLLDEAAAASPDAVEARALRFQELGRWELSLALFDALVRRRPDSARFLADRGVARFLSGRRLDAVHDLARAASLDPADLRTRETLEAARSARAPKLFRN